ncbi:MAG TPA: NUDIX domain-containing protein [Prolixibacteraceae bacterium]
MDDTAKIEFVHNITIVPKAVGTASAETTTSAVATASAQLAASVTSASSAVTSKGGAPAAHPGIYSGEQRFYMAVDCIIFGFSDSELKLLIINRILEPEKGKWSLMGGFVQPGENLDQAANRVLFDLTGLKNIYLNQLITQSEIVRDSCARVFSTPYYALIKVQDLDPSRVELSHAKWCPISQLPSLIFDHNNMVDIALRHLRIEAQNKTIGFELLPHKFTIPELQSLYEAIYSQKFDNRNFRKNILKMDLLEKLDEKDRQNSRKGAWLYQFNEEKYHDSCEKGIFFNIPI